MLLHDSLIQAPLVLRYTLSKVFHTLKINLKAPAHGVGASGSEGGSQGLRASDSEILNMV